MCRRAVRVRDKGEEGDDGWGKEGGGGKERNGWSGRVG